MEITEKKKERVRGFIVRACVCAKMPYVQETKGNKREDRWRMERNDWLFLASVQNSKHNELTHKELSHTHTHWHMLTNACAYSDGTRMDLLTHWPAEKLSV